MTITCDDIKLITLILQILTAIGASAAFLFSLSQYRKAQLWRRKEFIGNEVKSFQENRAVRIAFLMIDWGVRRIPFDSEAKPHSWPRVTRQIQIAALEPDILRPLPAGADPESYRRYSDIEVLIRDTYDVFFDELTRLASFAQAELFEDHELLPYLDYWLKDITSDSGPHEDLRWRLALFCYIQFYRFRAVQAFFKRLNYDISVRGPIWNRLRSADTELAEKLERACRST